MYRTLSKPSVMIGRVVYWKNVFNFTYQICFCRRFFFYKTALSLCEILSEFKKLARVNQYCVVMPRPHRVETLSDDACLTCDVCLSDVCLSVAYIGSSREQRGLGTRKTKIGTEIGHVTRDSDITFKVKRSKVNLQGAGAYWGGLPHSLLKL